MADDKKPVLKRVAREWVEACPKCSGRGHVERREHFQLCTEDEYPTESLAGKDGVPHDAYTCSTLGGSEIFATCTEALKIASIVGRPVAFEFNGRVVVAHGKETPEELVKDWWPRVYGKTYEESMRDR